MADSGDDEEASKKNSKCFVQNKALSAELRNKKRKIAILKGKVKRLKTEQRTFDSTCSLINQTWTQLTSDLESIVAAQGKTTPTQDSTPSTSTIPARAHLQELLRLHDKEEWKEKLETVTLKRESLKDLHFDDDIDIFLKQEEIEGDKDSDSEDAEQQDETPEEAEMTANVKKETETLLRSRRDFTVSLLNCLLSPGSSLSKDEHMENGVEGSSAGLIKKQRKVSSELASSKDKVCTLEQIIADMRVQVQEAELEKHRAIRDLNRFRVHESMGGKVLGTTSNQATSQPAAAAVAPKGGSASSTPHSTAEPSHSLSSSAAANAPEDTKSLKKELELWKSTAENRLKELESLREEQGKLRGKLANAETSPEGNDSFVKKHPLYLQSIQNLENEKSTSAKHLKECTKTKQDLETLQDNYSRCILYKEKVQKDVKEIQQKLSMHFTQELKALTDKCDTMQMQHDEGVETKRKLEQKEKDLKEMKTSIESLRQENASLKIASEMRERQLTMDLQQGKHQSFRGDMQKEIDSLQNRLDNDARNAQRAASGNGRLQDHLEDLNKMVGLLRQNQDSCKTELALCKEDLMASRAESEALLPEIESIAATNDDLRKELEKTREEVKKKEEHYLKQMHHRHKAQQVQTLLEDEKRIQKEAMQKQEIFAATQMETIKHLKREIHLKDKSMATVESEMQRLAKQFRMLAHQQKDIQQSRLTLTAELDSLKSRYGEVKANNIELGKETEEWKHKAKRFEEDVIRLKKKVSQMEKIREKELRRLSTSGSSDNEALLEEIARLKKMVYCSFTEAKESEEDHEKDCMIVQCGHTFSRVTIDKLIALRQRKCPLCGLNFALSDVKKIHL